jgi:hypothetical protein
MQQKEPLLLMLDADFPFGIIRIAMLTANRLFTNDIITTSRRTANAVILLLRMRMGLLLHISQITPGSRPMTRVYYFTTRFLPPTGGTTVASIPTTFVFGFRFLSNFHG